MRSESKSARSAIESALVHAEQLIELTHLNGFAPALWDARAAFAELVGDRPARSRFHATAEAARARLGVSPVLSPG